MALRTVSIPISYQTKAIGLPHWCVGGSDLSITFYSNLDIEGQLYSRVLTRDVDYTIKPDDVSLDLFYVGNIISIHNVTNLFIIPKHEFMPQFITQLTMSLEITDQEK